MNRPLLFFISLFIQSCVAGWVIFRWKHFVAQQRLLSLLLIATPISGISELWMGLHGINNLWVSHLFTLLEFLVLLSLFFGWKQKKKNKKLLLLVMVLFVIFWLVSKFTFEPLVYDDTYSAAIAKIIITIAAVWILFDILKDSDIILKLDSRIWIASGAIIYSVGSMIIFALFSTLVETMPELIKTIWPINWILMIVSTVLYARGIWCQVPKVNLQNQKAG